MTTTTMAPETTEMMQTTIGPCTADENSCFGHYTCDISTGFITCLPGFTGTLCTVRIPDGKSAITITVRVQVFPSFLHVSRFLGPIDSECPVSDDNQIFTCKSDMGGHCFNQTCCCPPGFTGENCEEQIRECLAEPCLNGATCRDLINGFECFCIPGLIF